MATSLKLFIVGVTASFGPCLLFCSPMVIPYVAATRKGIREGLKAAILFSVSRIITFSLLGLLAGILGELALTSLSKSSTGINILIGAVIIVMGGFVISGKDFSSNVCRVFKMENRRAGDMVLLGVVMALLPCASQLGVLAYIAVESKFLLSGALYGLSFSSGQVISLFILFILATTLSQFLFKMGRYLLIFRIICGSILIILGIKHIISILS